MKTEKRQIKVCGGHAPVTKKPADGECVGHLNLRTNLKHW